MRVIRHVLRSWTVLVLATASVLAGAVPVAAAGRTETGTFPIEEHFVDTGSSDACGFPVTADLTGRGTFQVRLDGDGNPTDVAVHIYRTGTLSGNGVSLSEFDRINLFLDLQSGASREVGIEFRVSAAGSSPAIFDRGRLVFDANGNVTFEAGPHPALAGDFAALCVALGA